MASVEKFRYNMAHNVGLYQNTESEADLISVIFWEGSASRTVWDETESVTARVFINLYHPQVLEFAYRSSGYRSGKATLHRGSNLGCHASRLPLGMNPRPLAVAYYVALVQH